MGHAPVVIIHGLVPIEFDSLVKVVNGAFVLVFAIQGKPAIVVITGVPRIQADCSVEIPDRVIVVALAIVSEASRVEGLG